MNRPTGRNKTTRQKLIRALRERQRNFCRWCGMPLPHQTARVELDHIEPRSRGGCGCLLNLQLLHKRCNRAKGDGDMSEAPYRLARLIGGHLKEECPVGVKA